MSDFFGPAQMLDEYKNIVCDVDGSQYVISVNKYRNANNPPDKGGCQDSIKLSYSLKSVAPDAYKRAGNSKYYAEAFMGKGAPRTIKAILETFYVYSAAFIKQFGNAKGTLEGKIAKIMADDNISWQDGLQQICDLSFGIDCNAFVGHWLMTVQPDFKLNYDSKSNNVRAIAKSYRNTLEEIEYWDVMCYAKNEHIAAVDHLGHGPGRFQVCQSAGGGPRINEYGFLYAGKERINGKDRQKFRLAAPTPRDIGSEFFVVSLW
jgi:hypothetical protein